MHLTWHSFDLRTGARGLQLDARAAGELSRIIGESTETTIEVSCWNVDTDSEWIGWDEATLPGRTMLVALTEDGRPVWGGMVLTRQSDPGVWVTCQCVTLEHYFTRRYTGTVAIAETDQATIATTLVESTTGDGITFTIDAPTSGVTRDAYYADEDDKTILDALTEVLDLDDGLDFTVDLDWANADRTALDRIVRFRTRLGSATANPVTFELPGPVVDFTYVEDYGPDNGANDVLAISSGQGSARPQSDRQVATDLLDNGWARFERRFTPAENETSQAVLNSYASAELTRIKDGLTQLTLVANLDESPLPGVDWHLGDDVSVVLTCPRFPARTDPDGRQVPGYSKVARCVGWDIDLDARTLTPRLQEGED